MAGRALALYPRRVLWCCLWFLWFTSAGSVVLFPPRPRHQPRGETTNTTGTVAAADEHTSPAKLPCRRAVGSSRQVAVIVPAGPRIEADAANFIVARLA